MVNELKLAVVHFTHQNPMQICACAWIYRWTKNYGKSGLGHRASSPPGRGQAGRGPVFSKTRKVNPAQVVLTKILRNEAKIYQNTDFLSFELKLLHCTLYRLDLPPEAFITFVGGVSKTKTKDLEN